jgi:hypothetical protein
MQTFVDLGAQQKITISVWWENISFSGVPNLVIAAPSHKIVKTSFGYSSSSFKKVG